MTSYHSVHAHTARNLAQVLPASWSSPPCGFSLSTLTTRDGFFPRGGAM